MLRKPPSLLKPPRPLRDDGNRDIKSRDTGGSATKPLTEAERFRAQKISNANENSQIAPAQSKNSSSGRHKTQSQQALASSSASSDRSGQIQVVNLAAQLGVPSEKVIRVCRAQGFPIQKGEDWLTQDQVCKIRDFYRQVGLIGNSPQPKPVVVSLPPVKSNLIFNWPGKVRPFAHQVATTEFLVANRRAFCFNDMGTGKTLSVLWAFHYLKQQGLVKSMLVVCPLSTLQLTWANEIRTHFNRTRFAILHGPASERRKLLREPADIYLINHDGIKVDGIVDILALRADIDLVVVDEIAQVGRNAGNERYYELTKVINRQSPRMAWGLTGTPTPNAPTDAWAQCRLLVPERVPPYFNPFKNQVMRQINQFLWIPRAEALDVVHNAMQPQIRYMRDECIDLPDCMYETRTIELTEEQSKAYQQMLTTLRANVRNQIIDAQTLLVMTVKLLQIACGAAYSKATGEQETVFIPATNRLNELLAVVEEAYASVIVFVPFLGVLEHVIEFLRSKEIPCEAIHGGVSQAKRSAIFERFQNDLRTPIKQRDIRVLVASPSAMAHGLTLTAANTIVWFGPITKNEIVQQANARISRPGQRYKQLIVRLQGSPIEELIYERLIDKQRFQESLLELFGAKGLQPDAG